MRRLLQPMASRLLMPVLAALLPLALLLMPPAAHAAMDYAKQVLIGHDFAGADLRGDRKSVV